MVPSRAPILDAVPAAEVKIGDLEDLEKAATEHGAEMVIGNSHAVASAERLGVPMLRVGFPQYDLLGGYQRCWIGYRRTRQALFDLANIMLTNNAHEVEPYKSYLAQKPEYYVEESSHDYQPASAGGGLSH